MSANRLSFCVNRVRSLSRADSASVFIGLHSVRKQLYLVYEMLELAEGRTASLTCFGALADILETQVHAKGGHGKSV